MDRPNPIEEEQKKKKGILVVGQEAARTIRVGTHRQSNSLAGTERGKGRRRRTT